MSFTAPSLYDVNPKGVVKFAVITLKEFYGHLISEELLRDTEASCYQAKIRQLDDVVNCFDVRRAFEKDFYERLLNLNIVLPFYNNHVAFYRELLTKDELDTDEQPLRPHVQKMWALVQAMVDSNTSFDSEIGQQLSKLAEYLLSITPQRNYFGCDGNSPPSPRFFLPAFNITSEISNSVMDAASFMLFPWYEDIPARLDERFLQIGKQWVLERITQSDLDGNDLALLHSTAQELADKLGNSDGICEFQQ